MRTQDRLALRRRAARTAILWTLGTFLVATVIAVAVFVSFAQSGQACYFGTEPCPEASDPRYVWLLVACFGVPLIWLLGLLILASRATNVRRG